MHILKSKVIALAVVMFAATLSLWAGNEELIGEWKCIEGGGDLAMNSVPNHPHGQLKGGATFVPDSLLGGAIDFPLDTSFVLIPHDAAYNAPQATIQVWIKINALQDADVLWTGTANWVRRNTGFGGTVYGIRILKDGSVWGIIGNDDPQLPQYWVFLFSQPNRITVGSWHLLDLSWNGQVVSLFIDGEMEALQSYVEVPVLGLSYAGTTNEIYVGLGSKWPDNMGTVHEFIGQMTDLHFYDAARAPGQIKQDYKAFFK